MTASLLVLVPVALLVLISGFCFVGCSLDVSGLPNDPPPPFTTYSGTDVIPMAIAYWPLDEAAPADDSKPQTAHDAKGPNPGQNPGQYKHKGNAPGMFPCPGFQVGGGVHTAAANGFMSLGQISLVKGDVKQPANLPGIPNIPTTGMQVDGGFVTVPFNSVINPPVFTVEAWVRPEWDPTEKAFRAVVDSRDNIGGAIHGFVLWCNEDGNWEAALGDVNGGFLLATAGLAVKDQPTHLVLTFDGAKAVIFVNNVPTPPFQMAAAYSPNTTQDLVIGAGEPWLDDRMNSTGNLFFPIFPFNGTIQDVAIYDTVLADKVIMTHFNDGNGMPTAPG